MEAENIVRALAARDPAVVNRFDDYVCMCCKVGWRDELPRFSDKELRTVTPHDPDCPWRLAREWVAEHDGTSSRGHSGPPGEWTLNG